MGEGGDRTNAFGDEHYRYSGLERVTEDPSGRMITLLSGAKFTSCPVVVVRSSALYDGGHGHHGFFFFEHGAAVSVTGLVEVVVFTPFALATETARRISRAGTAAVDVAAAAGRRHFFRRSRGRR